MLNIRNKTLGKKSIAINVANEIKKNWAATIPKQKLRHIATNGFFIF